jgi:nitrogen fixation protein FixH
MRDPLAHRWPWGIAAVLALTILGNAAVYWAANDVNAAAVEPDYYRKGVQWDSTLAQERRNRALGWTVEAVLGPRAAHGGRRVSIRMRDAAGGPLAAARVELTAIHNALATHPVHAVSLTDAAGESRLDAPLEHSGLWELRLVVTHGADRYTADLRRDTDLRSRAPW